MDSQNSTFTLRTVAARFCTRTDDPSCTHADGTICKHVAVAGVCKKSTRARDAAIKAAAGGTLDTPTRNDVQDQKERNHTHQGHLEPIRTTPGIVEGLIRKLPPEYHNNSGTGCGRGASDSKPSDSERVVEALRGLSTAISNVTKPAVADTGDVDF